ncbi:MAG TPA: RHS repeat-associated core domain-containing protein [Arcobacter sp.]|nr:RHS repeat-associated core domain-containing protein [Arcobacter sp.]
MTNQQGTVVQRTAYKPFGEKVDIQKLGKGKEVTNRGFTGYEHIEGSEFIHMNARLYDSTIGRFLSADTIVQAPFKSQSFNRYSYVFNNPLYYTDPTGHYGVALTYRYSSVGVVYNGGFSGNYGGGFSGGYVGITTPNVMLGGGASVSLTGGSVTSYGNYTQSTNGYTHSSFAIQFYSNTLLSRIQKEQFNTTLHPNTLGVRYVYAEESSGDIAIKNGIQYNNLSSYDTILEREYQLNMALDLIVNASKVNQNVKDMFTKYMKDYYIVYTDTPFLELTPGDKVNTYNGVHHADNFSGRTRLYRTNDGSVSSYRVQGRGIEYSSLIWTHGGGYLSQNFIEVLFHEILHNRNFYGTGHTRIKNGMNIYQRATYHANQFFESYPELKEFR